MSTPSSEQKIIDKRQMQKLISKNIFISILAKIFYLMTRFLMPPLILSFIGLAQYGLWAICFTIISYLGLGAFGVSNVYVRYVAEYHAKHEVEKINGLLSTGILLVLTISLILLGILWLILPTLIVSIFNGIPANLHETAFYLFYGTACIFMFHLSLSAFKCALNGLQRQFETTVITVACTTIETILIVIFLFNDAGVYGLLYASIIQYVISIAAFMVVAHQRIPNLSISIYHFDHCYIKLFYRYGGILQLSGTLSIIIQSFERLLASITVNVAATALIDFGKKFPTTAASIPGSMNAVYLPAASYMHSQNRQAELLRMYLDGSRSMSLLSGLIMGFLAAFAQPIVTAWLGTDPDFYVISNIIILSTFTQHIHILTGPSSAFFNGIEQPLRALLYPLMHTFLLIIAIFILLNHEDIAVLTIVQIAIAVNIICALAFIIYSNYVLGVKQLEYIRWVVVPGSLPYAVGFALVFLLDYWMQAAIDNRWYSLSLVLWSGLLYIFLAIPCIYFLIYNERERRNLRRQMLRGIVTITSKLSRRS